MPPFSAAGSAAAGQLAVPVTSLAEQAFDSLCYDFPVVDTPALAALASAYRRSISANSKHQFPITSRFVSGLRYLVESHFERKTSTAAPADYDSRSNHLVCLCGCVFLKAPARALTAAPQDSGASLNRLLAFFSETQEAESDDIPTLRDSFPEFDLQTNNQDETPDVASDQMADELDDDDTEWEPIEMHINEAQPITRGSSILMQEYPVAEWPELISRVMALGSLAPFEVTNTGAVWDELQLSEDLILSLKVLKNLGKPETVDVMPLARLYSGLMCDHVTGRGNLSIRGQDIGRLVTAMLGMTADTGNTGMSISDNRAWEGLSLRVLATLSSKVRGPGNQERALWQTISSNLHFLEEQIARLSVNTSTTVLMEEVEMVFQSLCFWLKHAPGNASVGRSLMQTGILRTALQTFLRAGTEPQMEVLREFLLLAMARSTEVAQFLVEVPSFVAAISDPRFLKEDTLTWPHGVVWALLLTAGQLQNKSTISEPLSQAADLLNHELNKISKLADTMELTSNPMLLTKLLLVLQQLTAACSGSSNRLWQKGSSLDCSLALCHTALRSLLSTMRGLETKHIEDAEKYNEQERRAEKSVELLTRVLPILKQLTATTNGNGCSKAD